MVDESSTESPGSTRREDAEKPDDSENHPMLVVAVGAPENGSRALAQIFSTMPSGHGIAFVIVGHSGFAGKNRFLRSLSGKTAIPVVEAGDGMPLLPDRIHVVPADRFLGVTGAVLSLHYPVECDGLRMPIDHFFCALASDQGHRACGVVLAGTGSDGEVGLSEIRAAGGWAMREKAGRGTTSGRTQATLKSGISDMRLPLDGLAGAIIELADRIRKDTQAERSEAWQYPEEALKEVLAVVREKAGYDFRGYKPNTLMRRIRRRMTLADIPTPALYGKLLREHPEEADLLRMDLLIGVTEFFRQPRAWEVLKQKVIAPLVDADLPGSEIRAWVPGCSTGKEVYSLAMLLTEQLERTGKSTAFTIFATDANPAALAAARAGIYTEEELGEDVPAGRRNRFFVFRAGGFHVSQEIRDHVIFAPQSLTTDPPFSRLDLVICRNVLIYLDQEVQRKIISLFHFSLRNSGFLFLGNAETIGGNEELFEPVSKKWRIYRRIGVGRRVGVTIPVVSSSESFPKPEKAFAATSGRRVSLVSTAQQVLLDRFAPACVMIDRKYRVLYVHGAVEDYLKIPSGELTTKVVDMAREGLRSRLRGSIDQCVETNKLVSVRARVRRGEKSIPVKATVSPLRYPPEADGLLLIAFEDHPLPAVESDPHGTGQSDIAQLQDELRIMRKELQNTIGQLESSNDRLKASNEEVTAFNEELQAANEELATSKEELQSLNDELNTVNARLQEKIEELENANNDVNNLLSSTSIATVFLDKNLNIRKYTPAIAGLISLIPSDVGRPMSDVLCRFYDKTLLEDAAEVLSHLSPLSKEIRSYGGSWYIRRITPYRTQDDRIKGVVITFVDVCDIKQAQEALAEAHEKAEWLARFPEENPNPVVRVSEDGIVLYSNPAASRLAGWMCREGEPLPGPLLSAFKQAMPGAKASETDVALGGRRYAAAISSLQSEGYANVYGRDITARKEAEDALRQSEQRVRLKLSSILDPEGDIGRLELADIIDVQAVQSLMDNFYELAHIPMSIVDLQGNVLVGVGWQKICTNFHRVHPDARRYCIESDLNLSADILPGESRLYKCKHNMWDIATPIMVREQHVGNIFSGQFFLEGEPLDYAFFRAQAEKYGFDEKAYIEALEAVPRLTREVVDAGMSFFMKFADKLSKLSYSNIELARLLAERDALTESLRESRADLNRAQAVAHTGSWRLDVRQNRLQWSDETYRIFGIPKGTPLTYATFLDVVHPDDRAYVDKKWSEATAGEHYDIEHRIVVRNTVRWVRERAEMEFESQEGLLGGFGTVQDITGLKQAEEKAQQQNAVLEAINRVFHEALTCRTEEELGGTCLRIAEGLTQSRFGFLGEIGPDRLLHDIAISDPGWELCTMDDKSGHRRPPGDFKIHGLYGRVLADGKSLLTNDPFSHPDSIGIPEGHPPLKAFLGVPLASGGKTIGMIAVGNREGGYMSEQKQALEALAPAMVQALLSKRAEKALRAAKEEWERTFDSVPDMITILDNDHRVRRANRSMAVRLGVEPEQCVGLPCYEVVHGTSAPPAFCPHSRTVADGKEHVEEVHEDRLSGDFLVSTTPLMNESGKRIGSVHVAHDITGRKKAEWEREITVEFLRLVNEIRSTEELIRAATSFFRKRTGCDAVGIRFEAGGDYSYFEPQGFEGYGSAALIALRSGDASFGLLQLNDRKKDQFTPETIALWERLADYLSVALAKLHAEEELRKSRDELEQRVQERTAELAKMNEEQQNNMILLEQNNRELEDFAHVASHDLQEPLRKIQTFADRLISINSETMNDKTRDYVQRMQRAAERMRDLLQDLLQYSLLTSAQEPFTRFSLKKPVEEAVTDLGVLCEEVQGRVEIGPLPDVFGDRVQMRQLFQNLISNGLKYRDEQPPVVHVYEYPSDSQEFLEVHVKDNGIGFDEPYLSKIFKPFQRLHGNNAKYSGTGMGLAICRKIVERYGGTITAKSTPGHGATFIVKLPRKT
ncbi:CheR methyltransferase, SAM binding domain protein [delta proteobacterium NaphS2]|nr:CheR methyltransferase, SAM binding domain protein [delta proteobacterium NaphS2]